MKDKFGISGSTLKWIAIVVMAVDHIGACILETYVMNAWGGAPLGDRFLAQWSEIYAVDRVIRLIGRPAFPIFCFLLVEGFIHTRDVKKYAVRLGLFALVSEIPFDLALRVRPVSWQHQNVFFTLLIGLLAIWFIRSKEKKYEYLKCLLLMGLFAVWYFQAGEKTLPVQICAVLSGAGLADLLNTDYHAFGVLLIIVLYMLRDNRYLQCAAGVLCCAWEKTAPLAFLPILFYNGERGRQPKWFFYWFYPLHLLIYSAIGAWLLPAVL